MKIRSSKELKESMKNLDSVVNFQDDEVEVHSDMDIVMTAAYDENIKAEEYLEEIKDELGEKAEDVIPEDPESPAPDVEIPTSQLKLDESLEDFTLLKEADGRSRKMATRGEDEGDPYLDYTMYDFVSELLSGKDCNTNPAPITPIVWRRDPKDNNFKYMPMKKFMTQGEDSVSYGGENEAGAFDPDQDNEEEITNQTDPQGMFKGVGVPQMAFEQDGFRVYSSNLEDFEQAQQGLAHYGIKYGEVVPKLNKRSHWAYSMKVYIPADFRGEFLSLTDWLLKTNRKVEDVMRPNFVNVYNKKLTKLHTAEDLELVKEIFDSYLAKKNNDYTLDTDDLLKQMFDELEGLPFNKDEIEQEFRKAVDTPSYYDIFDKYIDMKEADPKADTEKLFNKMIKELKSYKIKFNKEEAYQEFLSEI